MTVPAVEPETSALVLIDLQRGVAQRNTAPYPAAAVISNSRRLVEACRRRGIFIVLVHVQPRADGSDALHPDPDETPWRGTPAPDWGEFVPELLPQPEDIVVNKKQWGAFYGTDLDLQLRRRGIKTIILGGIATNYGVESTARDAYERTYRLIFVEDAMASMSAEMHAFPLKYVFPRIGRLASTDELLDALGD